MWILRYSLILFPFLGHAQETLSDSSRSSWAPRALVISAELSGLLQPIWCGCGTASQLELQLPFEHILLELQAGYTTRKPVALSENASQPKRSEEQYSSQGFFWRLGPALRIGPDEGNWAASLGLHYAEAGYREALNLRLLSRLGAPASSELSAEAWQRLRWWELSFGVKVALWKGLMVGYRTHFAFGARRQDSSPELDSFYSPGYGRLDKLGKFGIRYYLSYRLPL